MLQAHYLLDARQEDSYLRPNVGLTDKLKCETVWGIKADFFTV